MKISLIVDTHFIALLLLLHWQTNKTKNDLFVIAHTAHSIPDIQIERKQHVTFREIMKFDETKIVCMYHTVHLYYCHSEMLLFSVFP